MSRTDPTDLDRALALARKALEDDAKARVQGIGEWRQHRTHDLWTEIRVGHGLANTMIADCLSEENGKLIVASRTREPLIARALIALAEENERLRAALAPKEDAP